jgi:alpha-L-fucosidase
MNVAPKADGSLSKETLSRLKTVGKWLRANGEAVYGDVDHTAKMSGSLPGNGWTLKGRTGYYWVQRWSGSEHCIGAVRSKVKSVQLLHNGARIDFVQKSDRLILRGLPNVCPDMETGTVIFKMEFAGSPLQTCTSMMGARYKRASAEEYPQN